MQLHLYKEYGLPKIQSDTFLSFSRFVNMMEENRQSVHSDELNSIKLFSGKIFMVKLKKCRNILTNGLNVTIIDASGRAKELRVGPQWRNSLIG